VAATTSAVTVVAVTPVIMSNAAATAETFTLSVHDALPISTITPPVQVSAQDAFGNLVPTFVGTVTVAIAAGTGTSGATLRGTTTVAAVSGVATFATLSISTSGTGYALTATATGLTTGASMSFNI